MNFIMKATFGTTKGDFNAAKLSGIVNGILWNTLWVEKYISKTHLEKV